MQQPKKFQQNRSMHCWVIACATTIGTGGDWSPSWGPTIYWFPQFLGRSLLKARNFKASSHQNAGFNIWVFKNFPGVIPPDPHSGKGRPPPAPNTQPSLWPGAGRKRPGVETQTLVPLDFSDVVVPLSYSDWCMWFSPLLGALHSDGSQTPAWSMHRHIDT